MSFLDNPLYENGSTENPNIHQVARLLETILECNWFEDLFNKIKAQHPEVSDPDNIYSELVRNGDLKSLIYNEMESLAEHFFQLSQDLKIAYREEDSDKLFKFSESSSLVDAFRSSEHIEKYSDLFNTLEQKHLDLLHAAITCQLGGLSRQAMIVYRQFTQNLFIHENQTFLYLIMDAAERQGSFVDKSKAGIKGNKQRHASNNLVKEAAIELYTNGNFDNPYQASRLILEQVKEIGIKHGSLINWDINGQKRIYTWLTSIKKS